MSRSGGSSGIVWGKVKSLLVETLSFGFFTADPDEGLWLIYRLLPELKKHQELKLPKKDEKHELCTDL